MNNQISLHHVAKTGNWQKKRNYKQQQVARKPRPRDAAIINRKPNYTDYGACDSSCVARYNCMNVGLSNSFG